MSPTTAVTGVTILVTVTTARTIPIPIPTPTPTAGSGSAVRHPATVLFARPLAILPPLALIVRAALLARDAVSPRCLFLPIPIATHLGGPSLRGRRRRREDPVSVLNGDREEGWISGPVPVTTVRWVRVRAPVVQASKSATFDMEQRFASIRIVVLDASEWLKGNKSISPILTRT